MESTSSTEGPGLWTEGFGAIGATLAALQKNGVTLEHLRMIRRHSGSNPFAAWLGGAIADAARRFEAEPILKQVGTIDLPAIPTFRVDDHYRVGRAGKVHIGYFPDGRFFRAFQSITEHAIPAMTLRVHELTWQTADSMIIEDLGGMQETQIALSQLWILLEKQGYGQNGILRVDGRWNVGYCLATSGRPSSIGLRWPSEDSGWEIDVNEVAAVDMMREQGFLVISR